MDALLDLGSSLVDMFGSLLNVLVDLGRVILPWIPLLAWVGYWTYAVNWAKALPVLRRGGLIGILLLMFVAVIIWGTVAPPVDGHHVLLGLTVSNFAGKFIYVTILTCIALLCGSVQLSGALGRVGEFPQDIPDEEHALIHGHGHGHGHGQENQLHAH